jgi:hypothetical protein
MYKMVSQAYARAQSDRVLLKFISMALDLMEREAKLLGLDAEMRNHYEPPPDRSQVQPTVWSLLAKAEPTDLALAAPHNEPCPEWRLDRAGHRFDPGNVRLVGLAREIDQKRSDRVVENLWRRIEGLMQRSPNRTTLCCYTPAFFLQGNFS